jgi:hypothetical protein
LALTMWPAPCALSKARRVGGSPMKQLIERDAKGERYPRYRKRYWKPERNPRQLRLPFWEKSKK